MLQAIDGAKACIALEMYIFSDDAAGGEFRRGLTAAASRGVQVTVLIDAWGSMGLPDGFWDELIAAGGAVRRFRPALRAAFLFRDHRKLLLVDDRIAFIGGLNIADEYYRGRDGEPPWRDNALEIAGHEVMKLRRSFNRMWMRAELPLRVPVLRVRDGRDRGPSHFAGIRFLESGPEDPMQPLRKVYRSLINGAGRSIDLAMSYFYPSGRILRALKRAVRRGVRVRLLFPQRSDVAMAAWAAKGLYGRLLRAGVEVWEYRPAMLHAKLAIIDDAIVAGSANLDIRSGRINYELVAVAVEPALAERGRADFEDDLRHSSRISLADWRRRPLLQKLKERVSYWLLARADLFLARTELGRRMR